MDIDWGTLVIILFGLFGFCLHISSRARRRHIADLEFLHVDVADYMKADQNRRISLIQQKIEEASLLIPHRLRAVLVELRGSEVFNMMRPELREAVGSEIAFLAGNRWLGSLPDPTLQNVREQIPYDIAHHPAGVRFFQKVREIVEEEKKIFQLLHRYFFY